MHGGWMPLPPRKSFKYWSNMISGMWVANSIEVSSCFFFSFSFQTWSHSAVQAGLQPLKRVACPCSAGIKGVPNTSDSSPNFIRSKPGFPETYIFSKATRFSMIAGNVWTKLLGIHTTTWRIIPNMSIKAETPALMLDVHAPPSMGWINQNLCKYSWCQGSKPRAHTC